MRKNYEFEQNIVFHWNQSWPTKVWHLVFCESSILFLLVLNNFAYFVYLCILSKMTVYPNYILCYLILSLHLSCLVCMNIIFLHMLFCIYLALFVLNLSYLCILSACLVCRNVSTSRRSSHCSSRDMTYSSHLFTVFVHNNT